MKHSIITTVVLLLVSIASITFIFGLGERLSVINHSSDRGIVVDFSDSLRIDMSTPDALRLFPAQKISGYNLAVDLDDLDMQANVDANNSIRFYDDELLLSSSKLSYGMPDPSVQPSLAMPKKIDKKIAKLSDTVNAAIVKSREKLSPRVAINLSKMSAYRYEPIVINTSIYTDDTVTGISMYVRDKRSGMVRVNGDNRYPINVFKVDSTGYKGTYLHPFGADIGIYQAIVLVQTKNGLYGYTQDFTMKGRQSAPAGKTKKIVALEYVIDLSKKTIPSLKPNGGGTSYDNLYDWVRYMKCDTFWVIGGQTTGWTGGITPETPWSPAAIKNIDNLSKSPAQKDIKLGAYLMSYFAAGGGQKKAGYDIAVGYSYETKSLVESRHISLNDTKRIEDMISLFKYYDANPNVHYLGLDFIRTGERDGYEMVDELVALTGIYTPSGWNNMSKQARMRWLASNRGRNEISMKWRWFRAQKESQIIKSIKDSGIKKPLWAFTLGWAQGTEHGQDPYMFFDAGIDYDAIMIYEANRPQHVGMLSSWPRYLSGEYNVLVGNMVDNRLQDGSLRPELEYMKRIYESEAKFNRTSRIRGVFFFDISRMLWSKARGNQNGIREWANINASVVSRIEEKYSENPFTVTVELNERKTEGALTIVNRTSRKLNNVTVSTDLSGALGTIDIENNIVSIDAGETIILPFKYRYKGSRYSSLMSFRVSSDKGDENVTIAYTLLHTLKVSPTRKPSGVIASDNKKETTVKVN